MAVVLREEVEQFFPSRLVFGDGTRLRRVLVAEDEHRFYAVYAARTPHGRRSASFFVPRRCPPGRLFPWTADEWLEEIAHAERGERSSLGPPRGLVAP